VITAWRLVSQARAGSAFDGEGSYQTGNRWNHPGTRVVYLAATTSLAALEVLVHAGSPDHLTPFRAFGVQIPEELVLELPTLPEGWRQSPAPPVTKDAGSRWVASGASTVLRVPSVIVPWEFNYLASVNHPGFGRLSIGEPVPFQFDQRL